MTIGERICALRKGASMTQEGLANALGVTNQAVSKWETGQSLPDITQLPNLADLFGVSMDALFGREAPAAPAAPAQPQDLPWADDDTIRIVVYRGHRFIDRAEGLEIDVELDGTPLNVECWGNLRCDNVRGGVVAGGDVQCDDVAGNVSAAGYVNCGEVEGNITAGGEVNCGDVSGDVRAGGDVDCGDVAGHVNAGGDVACGDVEGNVQSAGDVDCGDVEGSVQSAGDVACGDVAGSVTTIRS